MRDFPRFGVVIVAFLIFTFGTPSQITQYLVAFIVQQLEDSP